MRLAESSGQDVRQIINVLQMARSDPTVLQSQHDGNKSKDSKLMLGPFDVIWPMFSAAHVANSSLNDRSDLFFVDYSMVPMIVQENYIQYTPSKAEGLPKKKADLAALDAVSKAADALCLGDIVNNYLRGSNQVWSLLPYQAIWSAVEPGSHMRCGPKGGPKEQGWHQNSIRFPSILGKMSNFNKRQRILREIQTHTREVASCDFTSMRLDYLCHIRRMITQPLIMGGVDGIEGTLHLMAQYGITRDDYDALEEIQFKDFRDCPNPFEKIPTKVKSAFTRAYNNKEKAFVQLKAKGKAGKGKEPKKKGKSSVIEVEEPKKEEEVADEDDDEDMLDFM